MSRHEVRTARPGEWHQIGHLLGDAFFDDPMWAWVAPDADKRRRHLGSLFAQLIRKRVEAGTAQITTDGGGAAVWAPPNQWKITTLESAAMTVPMLKVIGPRLMLSRTKALLDTERYHPTEEHWYLEIVGADPSRRGQGIGSALLDAGLERVDEQGLPTYLECSSAANLPLYNRYGFEVTQEIACGKDGPPLWLMWRNAR